MSTESDYVVISKEQATSFAAACLHAAGAQERHGALAAQVLVEGDYRGHFSHGLNRLDVYVEELRRGTCASIGEPVVLRDHGATAFVDGNNLLGAVVGDFAMNVAMEKAKRYGIGFVVANGSNHFGIAGWYSQLAMHQGMIVRQFDSLQDSLYEILFPFYGFSMTNSNPCAFGNRCAVLSNGTNPIAMFAPAADDDAFELDMATTTVALGKIEIAHRKGMHEMPSTWATDSSGRPITDPGEALDHGGCLPLGGTENTGGYKGFGLMMMVEILTGVLADAPWGPNVRPFKVHDKGPVNTAHCFIALNPEPLAPGFRKRLERMIHEYRNLPSCSPDMPVLVAGDPERTHKKKCDSLGGIPYHKNQIAFLNKIASQLEIEPLAHGSQQ